MLKDHKKSLESIRTVFKADYNRKEFTLTVKKNAPKELIRLFFEYFTSKLMFIKCF